MTMTPTQAQIDAAAKAVCQYRDVDPCPGKPCEDCIDKAKAALTAAADDTFAVEEYLRGLKSGTRATIERCAQVVESFNQRVMQRKDPDAIAAAIRALKDKS